MEADNCIIQKDIIQILEQKFVISTAILSPKYWDEPLTGRCFQLDNVELTYLFFELEKFYNVRISERFLLSYGFRSINSIAKVIEGHIGITN